MNIFQQKRQTFTITLVRNTISKKSPNHQSSPLQLLRKKYKTHGFVSRKHQRPHSVKREKYHSSKLELSRKTPRSYSKPKEKMLKFTDDYSFNKAPRPIHYKWEEEKSPLLTLQRKYQYLYALLFLKKQECRPFYFQPKSNKTQSISWPLENSRRHYKFKSDVSSSNAGEKKTKKQV